MQVKLDKNDRRLLLWTGAILLPLIVLLALLSGNEEDSGIPTTYSSTSSGAKAAYLYLTEQGYHVERWDSPPGDLPSDPRDAVLVLASPEGTPTGDEKNAIHKYLNRGGRILATGFNSSAFLPKTNITMEVLPEPVLKEFEPQMVSPLTRAGTIKMSPNGRWSETTSEEIVHYADNGKGIVVSYRVGDGAVVWWGGNQPLTNAGIGQAGNLSLLLNSIGGSSTTRILWDEYFHSLHIAHSTSVWVTPLKYGFWQFLAVFAALALTFGRRNAPIRTPSEPSRLSPLEFVYTLGNLYRRAQATRTALEVPYNRFRTLLVRRLGLRSDVSSTELLESARRKLGYGDPHLEETLQRVLTALNDPDIQEAKVLELAQKLNQLARNLKLISLKEEKEE